MKTSQLLGELQGNILRDLSHAVTPASQLWTPVSLVAYLNEAQDKFAEDTRSLIDSTTPEVTEVVLTAGESVYEIHDKVLEVLSVRVGERRTGRRLSRVSTKQVEDGTNHDNMATPSRWFTSPGETMAFATDEEPGLLRVYPTPNAGMEGVTLYLRVARLPIEELVVPTEGDTATDRTPEIPAQYHMDLCDWAAYRALRNHDTDAENIPKATTHRNQFQRVVDKVARKARRQRILPATFGGKVNN